MKKSKDSTGQGAQKKQHSSKDKYHPKDGAASQGGKHHGKHKKDQALARSGQKNLGSDQRRREASQDRKAELERLVNKTPAQQNLLPAAPNECEALERAARNGSDEAIESILEQVASQGQHFKKQNLATALHAAVDGCKSTAAIEAHCACVQKLVAQDISIDSEKRGKTILMVAAQKGYLELVDEILSLESDVTISDQNNMSALHNAVDVKVENKDVVDLLIERGANINERTKNEGMTPLMMAVNRGHVNIVRALVEIGVDMETQTVGTGDTALHIACEKGESEIVTILATQENADVMVNIQNNSGKTPMQISEEKVINQVEDHLGLGVTTAQERPAKPSHPYTALQNAGAPPKQTQPKAPSKGKAYESHMQIMEYLQEMQEMLNEKAKTATDRIYAEEQKRDEKERSRQQRLKAQQDKDREAARKREEVKRLEKSSMQSHGKGQESNQQRRKEDARAVEAADEKSGQQHDERATQNPARSAKEKKKKEKEVRAGKKDLSGLNSQSPPYQPNERGKGSEREVIDKEQPPPGEEGRDGRDYRKSNTMEDQRQAKNFENRRGDRDDKNFDQLKPHKSQTAGHPGSVKSVSLKDNGIRGGPMPPQSNMPMNMGQMPMPGMPPPGQGDYAAMLPQLMHADQLQAQMTLAQLFQNNGMGGMGNMNQLAGLNPALMMQQNMMPQMQMPDEEQKRTGKNAGNQYMPQGMNPSVGPMPGQLMPGQQAHQPPPSKSAQSLNSDSLSNGRTPPQQLGFGPREGGAQPPPLPHMMGSQSARGPGQNIWQQMGQGLGQPGVQGQGNLYMPPLFPGGQSQLSDAMAQNFAQMQLGGLNPATVMQAQATQPPQAVNPPSPIFADLTSPAGENIQRDELPIKFEIDLSDDKNLQIFIYRQKYNMKKNDCFNLERRKHELETELQKKSQEILRLTALNEKYQRYNSMRDQGLDDTVTMQKLIDSHNEQVKLISHQKEQMAKQKEQHELLAAKAAEAVGMLKKAVSGSRRVAEAPEDDTKPPASGGREVIDVEASQETERKRRNAGPTPSQVDEISEQLTNMRSRLEAADDDEPKTKDMSLQVLDYNSVKQILKREHQASNILLLEGRYETALLKPQRAEIKNLISVEAHNILLQRYPNFADISTRHDMTQIHNILHNEILLFKQDANAIVHEILEIKQKMIEKITQIVQNMESTYTVEVYGSHRTGLCMHWSDIDLCISPQEQSFAFDAKETLNQINARLEQERGFANPWITHVNYKRGASMPLVTITCSLGALMRQENMAMLPKNPAYAAVYERSICIDITVSQNESVGGHRHLGIECCELVEQYVKDCWIIEPLLLVLKQMLKVNGLNEPFKGGLSSYGLLLMIVGFLQHKAYDNPCDPQSINLGQILLEFLQYFSAFDYKAKQIHCRKPEEGETGQYLREVVAQRQPDSQIMTQFYTPEPQIMYIVDPLKPGNNVAKSSYQFNLIQESFRVGCMAGSMGCFCNSHFSLGKIESQQKAIAEIANLEMYVCNQIGNHHAQAAAVTQYLQSKQADVPVFSQAMDSDNAKSRSVVYYNRTTNEEQHVPIQSLYKPVHVDHCQKCDSILAKIIYSYAQVKVARESSSVQR